MDNRLAVSIASLLAISCCAQVLLAVEVPVEHSLDGGITFKRAGSIDGNFKLRDLTFTREALSPVDVAQLNALVQEDRFYKLRVAGSTTSVRASCFAAPASEVQEGLLLSTGTGGVPVFANYIVQSPGCQQPFRTAKPHMGSITLEVEVHPPVMGPVIFNLQSGIDAAPGSGPAGFGASQAPGGDGSISGGGSRVGATNRPLGAMPSKMAQGEGAGEEVPKEPPTWFQKNWMFVVGGGMVLINLISTAGRIANTPPGTPAPPRGQQ